MDPFLEFRTLRKSIEGMQLLRFAFGFLFISQLFLLHRYEWGDVPSANPKDSTTGIIDLMVKKDVPSFISSETILPLRLATTP
jgi:hypothetical protein